MRIVLLSLVFILHNGDSRLNLFGYICGSAVRLQEFLLSVCAYPSRLAWNAESYIPFRILISHHFQMTPTFYWVFLLALVGRAASMPQPLVVDACALICNPGAETESERERDPKLYPRYPKVDCKLQSDSEEHQAWVIASHCLKLCNRELSYASEANCFAMRSSLGANLGCYCEAFTPLSPNTMRLHESWRLNFLVKELAADILNVIAISPLDKMILCDIHKEMLSNIQLAKLKNGTFESCYNETAESNPEAAEPKAEPLNEALPTAQALYNTQIPSRANEDLKSKEPKEDRTLNDHPHSRPERDTLRIPYLLTDDLLQDDQDDQEIFSPIEKREEKGEESPKKETEIEDREDVMNVEKKSSEIEKFDTAICQTCKIHCASNFNAKVDNICQCKTLATRCQNL